ncbi:hypothetical protein BEL04_07175 [Mucilaginibacter sp. PPCGB 2223]|uniref:TonB-dependent receptor n=1 Tax=Mucilaginibacter sp. PPCGB 2223 TaxID=1886027 RepID=UPI00082499C0|nr:TonB-dependent receptor [Mucilaginibacter sp. PPCGB 2223]OCX54049.1 hypothetical protein BEL04_07175 [Mucilaginibacter sp. PPCGB 2223]
MKTFIMALIATGLCSAFNFARAQGGSGKIEGKVSNQDKKPVDAATITVADFKTLAMVKTALTNPDGSFVVEGLQNGKYRVLISAVGYQNYKGDSLLIDKQQTISLPAIVLVSTSRQLKEVEIAGQKPFVEQKIDRTVVNVSSSISSVGENALEALEKAPGVTVDDNGNITFKGRTGVMVLIDDKPTYLSGQDLANYLKSLPASQLNQIELMPNPPAKYDASGNAGVINIKLKKSKAKGFNGGIAASVGMAKYWRTLESVNLNYHVNKVNFFVNAGYGVQNGYRRLDVGRTYLDGLGNVTSSYTETAFFNPTNYNPNVKLGMDYYLSPKTTLGFVLTGAMSTGHNYNPVNSVLKDREGKLDSTITSNNNTQSKNYNGGINLNYSHQFDSLGQVLTFDLDYLRYSNRRDQSFFNNTYNAGGIMATTQDILDNLPADIDIYAAKTDYERPLKNKAKLSAGLKTSYVNTDNAANYFNVINSISTVDNNNTNRFLYKESINAAYISFNQDFKRLSIQAGLRAENTHVNGHQLGNAQSPDSLFTQQYTSLFPTAYILYKLDTAGKNALKFSYGRRIDRPYYQDLNPFVTILDKYSQFSGNPFLRPQYSTYYELTYSYKSMLTLTAEYNPIVDYQVEVDKTIAGGIFAATSGNLGRRDHWGITANIALNPAKWWSFNFYTELMHNWYNGQIDNLNLNSSSTYYYFNWTNQFNLGNGWSAELGTFYVTPTRDAQFTHRFREQTNAGIQKKVLKNKGAIKLSARDVFKANFSAGTITNVPGAAITYHNDNANRSVTLGFSYNFGSNKDNRKKRDTGAANTEAGRVGN